MNNNFLPPDYVRPSTKSDLDGVVSKNLVSIKSHVIDSLISTIKKFNNPTQPIIFEIGLLENDLSEQILNKGVKDFLQYLQENDVIKDLTVSIVDASGSFGVLEIRTATFNISRDIQTTIKKLLLEQEKLGINIISIIISSKDGIYIENNQSQSYKDCGEKTFKLLKALYDNADGLSAGELSKYSGYDTKKISSRIQDVNKRFTYETGVNSDLIITTNVSSTKKRTIYKYSLNRNKMKFNLLSNIH